MHADEVWHRPAVQTNVRRWLPHLGLAPAVLHEAELDWVKTFQALATNGDPTTLADHLKLVWEELPRFVPPTPTPAVDGAAASSDMLENPPYNTIWGDQAASPPHVEDEVAKSIIT